MSDALNNQLVETATKILESARATLSGVGMACFATEREQSAAVKQAKDKVEAAEGLLSQAKSFQRRFKGFS